MLVQEFGSYNYNQDLARKISLEFTAAYSDKATYHAYHEVYAKIFEGRLVKNFLEVGLFLYDNQQTDLFAWEKILPEANIYGVDIKRHLLFERDRIKTFYIDQADSKTFDDFKKIVPEKFDAILDDGAHSYFETINTFENLFETVVDGGVYLIEDILVHRYSDEDWEQNVQEIDAYFAKTGLNYEIFSTSAIERCVDSIILAVYK